MRRAALCGLAVAMLALGLRTAGGQEPARGTVTGAPIERDSFAYQRRIRGGPPGVCWLRLDLAALSHSHLGDVRIVSSKGVQVPYLLEDDPVPLRMELPVVARLDQDQRRTMGQWGGARRSIYAVALPLANMPSCRLAFETSARIFQRDVTLLARDDNARSSRTGRWVTVAWSPWRHTNPETPAAPLTLDVPRLDTAEARLVIEEGDNQPLPLERPVLEVLTHRLRFVREAGDELWLVYGRANLPAPRYDLALVEARLQEEPASEAVAEPESSTRRDSGRHTTLIFWVVLVAAILALLALLARLLRTEPQ